MIEIIGLYTVPENPDVKLVEVVVKENWAKIKLIEFTQEEEGIDRSSWQAPFEERYLNDDGTEVLGDNFKKPVNQDGITRITFFMYYLKADRPLDTPFGKQKLPSITAQPLRISSIVKYADPE